MHVIFASQVDDVVTTAKWLVSLGFDKIFLMCSSAGAPIGGSALERVDEIKGYMVLARPAPLPAHST